MQSIAYLILIKACVRMCMCDCLPFLSKPTFWEKILLVATCSGYYAIPKVKNKHITKQNSAATPQVILTATDSKSNLLIQVRELVVKQHRHDKRYPRSLKVMFHMSYIQKTSTMSCGCSPNGQHIFGNCGNGSKTLQH